ncbi:MAG: CaiB/BaiF CoA-transferase family protein [Actinomycetota bacterium]|nr:CaiB/BaiF CoA-transferase family protein [Actinomycetota bacterium]
MTVRGGPLDGIVVVEFEAIGPVPFACGMLVDMGAKVVRVARPSGQASGLPSSLMSTAEASGDTVAIDLKTDAGRNQALDLLSSADVLIEGFRPGTLERLGLGPDVALEMNQGLVYARVTGWGQDGEYASMAGHDINYIGLAGALATIGSSDRPLPPLNLVGDYGGGAMYAVAGVLAALVERSRTGSGQVIDIAMVDGAASLMGPIRSLLNNGVWVENRQANLLDGGAPFYCTYATSDGGFMAVGALEPAFYSAMVAGLGLVEAEIPDRFNPENWEDLTELFAGMFSTRSRNEWQEIFDGTDACVTPVLALSEVADHPHNVERQAIVEGAEGERPAPAPRFGNSL